MLWTKEGVVRKQRGIKSNLAEDRPPSLGISDEVFENKMIFLRIISCAIIY